MAVAVQPVDTFSVGDYTVSIYPDPDAESPRSWDNLGTCWFWHRRYNLGDPDAGEPFSFTLRDCSSWDEVTARIQRAYPGAVVLDVYLYDHSGLLVRTYPWDGWAALDSGQLGVIYALPEMIRQEFGVKRITRRVRERVKEILEAEIATLNQYLTGDVYYYTIERDGETVHACGSIYSLESCKELIKQELAFMGGVGQCG